MALVDLVDTQLFMAEKYRRELNEVGWGTGPNAMSVKVRREPWLLEATRVASGRE